MASPGTAVRAIGVIGAGLASAALAEGLSWLVVYRTEEYQHLKQRIESTKKRMEKEKEKAGAEPAKKPEDSKKKEDPKKKEMRKVGRVENDLRILDSDMHKMYSRATIYISAVVFGIYWIISSVYDGVVVAKLPFVPLGMFTFASHRNLPGDDLTDCSVALLYTLCAMTFRPNLQKLLGFAPPKSLAQLQMAQEQANFSASKLRR